MAFCGTGWSCNAHLSNSTRRPVRSIEPDDDDATKNRSVVPCGELHQE
jgi:hypothetical protein